jgi:hypothetical protein
MTELRNTGQAPRTTLRAPSSVPVFYYGTASNPVSSIDEPCPICSGVLVADLAAPALAKLRFAEVSLTAEALEWWRSLCTVSCGCGWVGSSFRPEEAIAA